MRKANPKHVVDDFRSQLDDITDYFERLDKRLVGTQHGLKDLSQLADQALVAAAAAFEGFLSDLFVACINRDPLRALNEVETRVKSSIKAKFGEHVASRIGFKKTGGLKVQDARDLLDPDGWNKTFKDAATLKSEAQAWLASPFRERFTSLSAQRLLVIEGTKAIRDFIVHRSTDSKKRMNGILAKMGDDVNLQHLGRSSKSVSDVGAFLKARAPGKSDRRVVLYLRRLGNIAKALGT